MPVTGLIYREAEIMSCFAVLTAGVESEILPTDWGAKHPDGRVCKSYPAERRRDNPSEGEFIKVRYSIHNHTFWTKLDLCETMFALYSACRISEFASALFPLLWSWSVTQTHAVLRTSQTNLFFFTPPVCICTCAGVKKLGRRPNGPARRWATTCAGSRRTSRASIFGQPQSSTIFIAPKSIWRSGWWS